jgi:hypothetical protein
MTMLNLMCLPVITAMTVKDRYGCETSLQISDPVIAMAELCQPIGLQDG